MYGTEHERVAAQFDDYQVVRRLHDVPPHEVFEVRADGRRAVCKRDTGPTGSAATEGRVTRFVGETTSVPAPAVLAVGDGYYVAEWHPDAPAPDAERRTDERWAEVAGRGLATLHDETARYFDGYGQLQFGDRDHTTGDDASPTARRDDWHAAALSFVRRRRPLLAERGHGDVADAVLDCFRGHPGAFEGAGAPVCCHGWWSPEHVAVAGETVACVVDFEHALAAPGEWDIWRTALPVFDGGTALRAFREGYERVRALPDGFAARQPLYAALHGVYFFESLYVQDRHDRDGTAERARRLRERVFTALDRLDAR